MEKKDKNMFIRRAMCISFVVLLVGGVNYLLMGILEFDFFGEVFGYDTIAGRLIYCIFGMAAVILAAIVIWKMYYSKKENKQNKTTASPSRTASTQKKAV